MTLANCNRTRVEVERFIKSFWLMKLRALQKFAAFYTANRSTITEQEFEYAKLFMGVIINPEVGKIQKAAAATGLDMILPEWRTILPNSILGRIIERESPEVARWRKFCLKRDKHRCVRCGSVKNLQVHHMCSWAGFPELRIEVDNGETLCGICHADEHPKMAKEMFFSVLK